MATVAKFRIDVAIHDLLMNSAQRPPVPAEAMGLTLPHPVFPQYPERLNDPGPETPPEKRQWGAKDRSTSHSIRGICSQVCPKHLSLHKTIWNTSCASNTHTDIWSFSTSTSVAITWMM